MLAPCSRVLAHGWSMPYGPSVRPIFAIIKATGKYQDILATGRVIKIQGQPAAHPSPHASYTA